MKKRKRKRWMKERESSSSVGEFTTHPTVYQQVRIAAQSSSPVPGGSLDGCVCHAGEMKLNCHFLSSDDPAVMEPKVERSIGNSSTRLVSFPLFLTGILILLISMLHWSGKSTVETKLSQCWSLGPRTLKLFYTYCFIWAWIVLSVCVCVFAWVNAERWSLQRRKEALSFFFVMMYNEDGNIYNAKFSHNEQNYKLNEQNSLNSRIYFHK